MDFKGFKITMSYCALILFLGLLALGLGLVAFMVGLEMMNEIVAFFK